MPHDFEDLLARAIELHELGDRQGLEAWLAEASGHEAGLRRALARLGGTNHSLGAGMPTRLGEFTLLQRLGGGGMGVVYLAEQRSLRRKVAVKVVRPDLMLTDIVRARFQREVEIIARLQHPGIVQVLAVGSEGPVPYFAMEYVTGCSMSDVLHAVADRRPADLHGGDFGSATGLDAAATAASRDKAWWEAVVECIAEVAETVAFVHAHGVLHRDIKPSNILLTAQCRTKLLDFGLARGNADPQLTQSGSELGSPAYMSPEQLRGEAIDERSDVYSLGVTLHQLLVLRLPFTAHNDAALRAAILAGQTQPRWWRETRMPRELATVVEQAMDVDRHCRYATMEAFATDLRAVLAARPVTARAPSWWARVGRWRRRRPFVAGAAGVTLALLLVAPLPMWWWQHGQSRQLDRALHLAEGDLGEAEAAIQRMLEHARAIDLAFVPQATELRLHLMRDAVGFYERMIARHPDESRLQVAAAECCWRYGAELRTLGRREEAETVLARAITIYEGLSGSGDAAVGVQHLLARRVQAALAREAGDLDRSEQRLLAMSQLATRLLARWPDDPNLRLQAAEIPNERAHVRFARGQTAEQIALSRQALAERRAVLHDHPDSALAQRAVASQCINVGDALRAAGDFEPARAMYAEAVLSAMPPLDDDYYHDNLVGEAWTGLGAVARACGRTAEAVTQLERALAHQRRLLAATPWALERVRVHVDAAAEYALAQLALASPARARDALGACRDSVASLTAVAAKDAFAADLLGRFAEAQRRVDEAVRAASGR